MQNQLVLWKLHVKGVKNPGFGRGITCKIGRIEEIACKRIENSGS